MQQADKRPPPQPTNSHLKRDSYNRYLSGSLAAKKSDRKPDCAQMQSNRV